MFIIRLWELDLKPELGSDIFPSLHLGTSVRRVRIPRAHAANPTAHRRLRVQHKVILSVAEGRIIVIAIFEILIWRHFCERYGK